MASNANNDPSMSGVKVESGFEVDKTTIIWLSVVVTIVTTGIVVAFVVLGRRFICAGKKRKNKIDYFDNRISFGAWDGAATLPSNPEKAYQPRESTEYQRGSLDGSPIKHRLRRLEER